MGVLVGVDVGNRDACPLQPLDLSDGFLFDVSAFNAAQGKVAHEGPQCWPEAGFAVIACGGIVQGRNGCRIRDRPAIHQYDMAPDSEGTVLHR